MKSTSFARVTALLVLGGCAGTAVSPPTTSGASDASVADAGVTPGGDAADALADAAPSAEAGAEAGTDAGAARDASTPADAGAAQDASALADAGMTGDAGEACPAFAAPVRTGFVANLSVQEASGVVNGRRNTDVLWVHSDSGAQPQVFALTRAGGALANYTLEGATAVDWEDIAIGPGPRAGEPYLYIADIGDNGTSRATVAVYRALEPVAPTTPSLLPPSLTIAGVEKFVLRYPDGAHNAETMLVDPLSGDLFIVEKASSGDSQVFRAAAPLSASGTITLESAGRLRFGVGALAGSPTTTGGDISPSGRFIAVRTYDRAFLWRRAPGESVARALAGAPCPIPLANEGQGEALGFASDERGYFTLSEGRAVPISYYARP
jgi:hypothetical protein